MPAITDLIEHLMPLLALEDDADDCLIEAIDKMERRGAIDSTTAERLMNVFNLS